MENNKINLSQVEQSVLSMFDSNFDSQYDKAVEELKAVVNNDKYSQKYKEDRRKEIENNLMSIKQQKKEEALNFLDSIIEKNKFEVDPEPEFNNAEEERLHEIKKSNKLFMLEQEFSAADGAEDYLEMAEKYGTDREFNQLLDLKLKKMSKEDGSQANYIKAKIEEERTPKGLKGIKQLKSGITTLMNMAYFAKGISEGLGKAEYKNLDKDVSNNNRSDV